MDVIEWFFCFGREDESFSMEGWVGDGDLEEELFKGQLEIFCGFRSEIERRFWYFHECNAEISKDFFVLREISNQLWVRKVSQLYTRGLRWGRLWWEFSCYIPPYLLPPRWTPSSWQPWVDCGSWTRRPSSVTWRICSRIWKPSSMLA
jgi:hypothetical protein